MLVTLLTSQPPILLLKLPRANISDNGRDACPAIGPEGGIATGAPRTTIGAARRASGHRAAITADVGIVDALHAALMVVITVGRVPAARVLIAAVGTALYSATGDYCRAVNIAKIDIAADYDHGNGQYAHTGRYS